MRLTFMIVLTGVFLATSCNSAPKGPPAGYKPQVGQVLAASGDGGSAVISLGTREGIRPGDSLVVLRDGREIGQIIIHEAKATQSAGTVVGGSGAGTVAKGDTVLGK
jgi:hypothetical protein